jgi:hypothetical protein
MRASKARYRTPVERLLLELRDRTTHSLVVSMIAAHHISEHACTATTVDANQFVPIHLNFSGIDRTSDADVTPLCTGAFSHGGQVRSGPVQRNSLLRMITTLEYSNCTTTTYKVECNHRHHVIFYLLVPRRSKLFDEGLFPDEFGEIC